MKPSAAAVLLLAALLAAAGAASADDTVNAQHMKPWPPGGCSGSGCGSSSSMFVSRLRGDNAGAATAQMTLVVDAAAQTATYSLMMYNVNGYTMSHIHVGAAGINGPPVVLLLPGLKAGQNTTIAAADLPTIAPIDICSMTYTSKFAAADLVQLNGVAFSWTDLMTNLAAGTLYANIHTAAAPAGLIRGQLLPSKAWKGNVEASCADRKGWKHGK